MEGLKDELDDGIIDDGNLDVWLNSVNENEFDERMDTYLSSEKLVHFEENSRDGKSGFGHENSVR